MGLGEIDFVICDEVYRMVGVMYFSNERDDKNVFMFCYSDEYIKSKKCFYMIVMFKVYSESLKVRVKESDNVIYFMDDESIFGEEIYMFNFINLLKM